MSSLWLQSCRKEGLSRFRNVRSKPFQETVASSDKDVENSEMSRTKTPKRSRSRRPCQPGGQGGLPIYRLSLVFIIGSSLSKLPSPDLPGSTRFVVPFCSLNQGAEAQGPSPETRRGTPLPKRPLRGKVPTEDTDSGYLYLLC